MNQKYTNDTMIQVLDEKLAWLAQKTKNVIKQTLLFPPHIVNAIEL